MRVFELEPGKESPFHKHENEHEAYVLSGRGELETEAGKAELKEGSTLFITARESHCFRNTGDDTLRFIDVIGFPLKLP
jgi:quercetin dioxygenase-like cupin family protein